ncbi:MAG: PTS sugar transporter subunit IIA [bacterium]|nr:PTS sugar transporter subunit IIA [bacterium]
MDFGHLLDKRLILLDLKTNNKNETIQRLVDLISKSKDIKDKRKVLDAIIERERTMSTGIGKGIAIPHAKSNAAKRIVVAFARSKEGVEFDAVDKNPVYLFFIVVGPEESQDEYLKVMAHLTSYLNKEINRKNLMEARSEKEIMALVSKIE